GEGKVLYFCKQITAHILGKDSTGNSAQTTCYGTCRKRKNSADYHQYTVGKNGVFENVFRNESEAVGCDSYYLPVAPIQIGESILHHFAVGKELQGVEYVRHEHRQNYFQCRFKQYQ